MIQDVAFDLRQARFGRDRAKTLVAGAGAAALGRLKVSEHLPLDPRRRPAADDLLLHQPDGAAGWGFRIRIEDEDTARASGGAR
jgi:hypothetical protein